MEQIKVTHTFEPVYNQESNILILGTFPSVKSREGDFYYHHPQNRFWKLIALLTGKEVPEGIIEKKELLLTSGIAIWDVIKSCEITGSSDSSIKNVVPADIDWLLQRAPIERIFGNGNTAHQLYMKYCYSKTGMEMYKLPSTSPANAAYSLKRLEESWRVIMEWEMK